MAKLERLGPSSYVLTLKDGTRVLYSYDTPVAAWMITGDWHPICNPGGIKLPGGGYVRADQFYSRTTSGHVSRFLNGADARKVAPEVIAALVEGV